MRFEGRLGRLGLGLSGDKAPCSDFGFGFRASVWGFRVFSCYKTDKASGCGEEVRFGRPILADPTSQQLLLLRLL